MRDIFLSPKCPLDHFYFTAMRDVAPLQYEDRSQIFLVFNTSIMGPDASQSWELIRYHLKHIVY